MPFASPAFEKRTGRGFGDQLDFDFSIAVVNGTSITPRLSRLLVQTLILSMETGSAEAMPFAKADLTIDSVPTSGEIDRALAKLEELAKERGVAVGVASALPISIERISAWTRTLDSHGLLLVPLTTAMLKSKSG